MKLSVQSRIIRKKFEDYVIGLWYKIFWALCVSRLRTLWILFFQTQKDLINIFHTRLSSLVSRRLLNVPPPSITSYIVYRFLFLPLQIDIYMKQFLGSSLYKPPAIPCMYLILVYLRLYIYCITCTDCWKWKRVQKWICSL